MAVKIVFIGNIFGGDDGIGPHMFKELKDHQELARFEVLELGVIGFDLLSEVKEDDHLIIIDALRANGDYGDIVQVDDEMLNADFSLVSQHDFGVEQTTAMLKAYNPTMKIDIFGIKVRNLNAFDPKISNEILDRTEDIKNGILKHIKCATQYLQK